MFRYLVLLSLTILIYVSFSLPAFAQLDRASAAPYQDVQKYYQATVKYAEGNKQRDALQSIVDMTKAIDAMHEFSKKVPSVMRSANMRYLAQKADLYLEANRKMRDRASKLYDKIKKLRENYSSELSSLKNALREHNDKFKDVIRDFKNAGAALKTSCQRCVR